MSIEKHRVMIDLAFDCNHETIDPWTIANGAVQKIKNFLQGEDGHSEESFNSVSNILFMNVYIDVPDIDKAKTLETKLKNNLDQFPPIANDTRAFNYRNWLEKEGV